MPDNLNPLERLRADRRQLAMFLAMIVLIVVTTEWGARAWLRKGFGPVRTYLHDTTIHFLSRESPSTDALAADESRLLVVGNSHLYGLPGLRLGDQLRFTGGPIIVDYLAESLHQQYPGNGVQIDLLSYPNISPLEILIRVSELIERGRAPTVAIFGTTWANIARGTGVRDSVRQSLRDPRVVARIQENLKQLASPEQELLRNEVGVQLRMIEHQLQIERTRSAADILDEQLTVSAGAGLALLGESGTLRARAMIDWYQPLQSFLLEAGDYVPTYSEVPVELHFNMACLECVFRILRSRDATIACYYTPERSDLPPIMRKVKRGDFESDLNGLAKELEIDILDGRGIVPNEYWGFDNYSPDRGHFTEPGHKIVADFLFSELDKRGCWQKIVKPGTHR